MKEHLGVWVAVPLIAIGLSARAQNDGDHCITDGAGRTYLGPDLQVGGGATAPLNMTIGTTPLGNATLRVRGDDLPVADFYDATFNCTFRSDVATNERQNWSMVRDGLQIGRLFHTTSEHFHIAGASGDIRFHTWQSGATFTERARL
jgi:hypothetical protein